MIRVFAFLAAVVLYIPAHATTWFVRADGGTRLSSHVSAGQCDGKSDLPAAGATGHHCAFKQFRYMWDDDSGAVGLGQWVGAGGDTVVVRGCSALAAEQNPANPACRIGWDISTGGGATNLWCQGIGNQMCFNAPIANGTAAAHTRILAGCAYDSKPGPCYTGNVTNKANLTQLFGGMGLTWTLDLRGRQWVDVIGFEITAHNKVMNGIPFAASHAYQVGDVVFDGTNTHGVTTAGTSGSAKPTWNPAILGTTASGTAIFTNRGPNCVQQGYPAYPVGCNRGNLPYDDVAANGIFTDAATGNILLQDLNIHGFGGSGIHGPIGGAITMTRVIDSFNAFAGWNFDMGTSGPNGTGFPNNPLASITASYVNMSWNGCNEEYPITHPIPCLVMYTISNNGFGDAWSGQDSDLASMTCDHCTMNYNAKDAFFGPHTAIGTVLITNSTAVGNGGQTWKANLAATGNWTMRNNVTNANCRRLAEGFQGIPTTYSIGIDKGNLCRSDGTAVSIVWPVAGNFELSNNTFVSASTNVGFDFACWNKFSAVKVGNGGTGYKVGNVLYVGGTQATVTVTSVNGNGTITGINLTATGQVTNAQVPFTEYYNFGGTGTGATITITAVAPVNCGGGPRVLRNNIFIGYTNPKNNGYNTQKITLFCYSGCQGNPGTSDDTQWTTRSNNIFWEWRAQDGSGLCSYPGETCADPLMTSEPPQTWTNETQLDSFDPTLASNSFYPGESSPVLNAGIPVDGITTDFYGTKRPTDKPTIGAVEPAAAPEPPEPPGRRVRVKVLGGELIILIPNEPEKK